MPGRTAQRVRFVKLEMERLAEGQIRARVTLEMRPDRTVVGTAECSDTARGDLRCVSMATVDALHKAVGRTESTIELIGARAVKAFDATVVIVALSAHREGRLRRLVGSYLAETDPTRGAALAVLNAMNRLLGVTTFSG